MIVEKFTAETVLALQLAGRRAAVQNLVERDPDDGDHVVPGVVRRALAELRLLHHVPFSYLVADASLLPPESIRFFYLDRNWTDALVQGALSVGTFTAADRAQLEALLLDRSATRSTRRSGPSAARPGESRPAGRGGAITGFLLRSRVVSGLAGAARARLPQRPAARTTTTSIPESDPRPAQGAAARTARSRPCCSRCSTASPTSSTSRSPARASSSARSAGRRPPLDAPRVVPLRDAANGADLSPRRDVDRALPPRRSRGHRPRRAAQAHGRRGRDPPQRRGRGDEFALEMLRFPSARCSVTPPTSPPTTSRTCSVPRCHFAALREAFKAVIELMPGRPRADRDGRRWTAATEARPRPRRDRYVGPAPSTATLRLLVPIDVQALVVAGHGPRRWCSCRRAQRPQTGKAQGSRPRSTPAAPRPGVHLHWAMPDALLRGSLGSRAARHRSRPAAAARPVGRAAAPRPARRPPPAVTGWVIEADTARVTPLGRLAGRRRDGSAARRDGPARRLNGTAGGSIDVVGDLRRRRRRFALHDPLDDLAELAPRGRGRPATYVVAGGGRPPARPARSRPGPRQPRRAPGRSRLDRRRPSGATPAPTCGRDHRRVDASVAAPRLAPSRRRRTLRRRRRHGEPADVKASDCRQAVRRPPARGVSSTGRGGRTPACCTARCTASRAPSRRSGDPRQPAGGDAVDSPSEPTTTTWSAALRRPARLAPTQRRVAARHRAAAVGVHRPAAARARLAPTAPSPSRSTSTTAGFGSLPGGARGTDRLRRTGRPAARPAGPGTRVARASPASRTPTSAGAAEQCSGDRSCSGDRRAAA